MHNLFGERFYSHREPAWHGLGLVTEDEMTAQDAFNATTPFTVTLEPLFTTIGSQTFELPNRAIMRHPVPDDPDYKVFGLVGPEYTLVSPLEICEAYDEAVNKPVETLGALGSGETMFLTTRLPSYSIVGDDVDNYLLVVSPYSGNGSIQVRLTPIRVVCQNTLIAAQSASSESYRIAHDTHAFNRLKVWMTGIVDRFETKSVEMQQVFTSMASCRVPDEDVDAILSEVYTEPTGFSISPIPSENAQRQAWFEENCETVRRRRQAVKEVFFGQGVGQDSKAAQGTAFGLFNAVVEFEQYRPTTKIKAAQADMLTGSRAKIAERAYTSILNFMQ